uniref:Zinc finger protein RFP n=1 Tax=Chrysemys picta bellii TaxID=8478 RepID=A0A8C3FPS2_CHRPI
MAAENPVESLQEEATCPICLEYFTEPVTLECGHNFCRACIAQCWEGSTTAVSCPQCRETVQQRNLRPNRQLANVVEIVKRLSLRAAKGAGGDGVCDRHQEALKLFCEEDQTPICVVCDRSRAHGAHTVVPIEEAAQEYKEKIQAHLKTLREEREKLLGFKVTGEGKSQEYLKQTQTERQKIVSEFQQLRWFLGEQERLLLSQLEKLDEEIERIQNENVSKLSEQISHLSELISELEGKCQKPASEFLQVRLSEKQRHRLRGYPRPEEISPELEERVSGFSQKTIALLEALRKFKANVTLDPDTSANPYLILSKDRKRVRLEGTDEKLLANHEGFCYSPCVLASEGFTSGRHYWGVEVGSKGGWAVGVARESVRRKEGVVILSPEEGIWAVERQWWGELWALTSPTTLLSLSRKPDKIRVSLNYEEGLVEFFDADNVKPFYAFCSASFAGEKIFPFFRVGGAGAHLRVCP